MKKLLSLMLVLVMVLTLFAGCGKKAETPAEPEVTPTPEAAPAPAEKEEAPAEEVDDESWKEEHPGWLCEEKTTLTVYTWEGVSSNFLPPSNDLFFWQWMEDYTNVHIEWEVAPYADYETVVSAKLAGGGTLNDIVMLGQSITTANNAGQNGMIADLSTLWDSCFTNIQTYMDENGIPYKNNISNADGSCYAIATLGAPVENRVVLLYNTLWMEELGLEIPKTIEDLDQVLHAMKDAGDLNGNGVDDEIILTSPWVTTLTAALNSSFDLQALENQPYFAADDNGVVYEEYTTENNKALLGWLSELYQDGILDPEITATSMDICAENVAAGRIGVVAFYSSFAPSYSNLTPAGIENPNTEYYTVGVPMTSEFCDEAYMVMYETYQMYTGISADCQNPELAAKWLDALYADPNVLITRCRGEEGVTWEVNAEGKAVPIVPADGSAWSINSLGCGQLSLPYVQTDEQLLFSKVGLVDWYLEDYAVIRDGKWISRDIPEVPAFTEDEQMLRDTFWTDLNAGWEEYRDKFIIGELSVEEDWDTFAEVLNALGLAEMTECYQSVYNRTH